MNRISWWVIGAAGAISLALPWPVMAVVACAAVSKYRGPDHYTKRMVPEAYRFKMDPGWWFVLVLAVIGAGGMLLSGTWWVLAVALGIATLRIVVWLCFRFPLVSWFVLMFIVFLFGIGIRRFMI
jgi:hypothetical protein